LRQYAAAAEQAAGENLDGSSPPLEVTEFAELAKNRMVHHNVVHGITKGMGHTTMTQVQTMTINQALKGDDM
jgi:ATP-dependent RNA helicase MSS116